MVNPIRAFLSYMPSVGKSCFINETSVMIGEVSLAGDVPVQLYVVLRDDVNSISISKRSNVQDDSVSYVSHKNAAEPDGSSSIIGDDVMIEHKVMPHGC